MKNGQQFKSVVCSTKVIVLRKPTDDAAVLSCGGFPMIDAASEAPRNQQPADAELLGGTVMGKRYGETESGIQVLCVTAGEGTLAINGHPLETEAVKQLPSSD
jgi:hypothetical protein